MSTVRIKGLDGIRAIAVGMVVLTHIHAYSSVSAPYFKDRVMPLISGRTGVLVFFVLSGFLITLLLSQERKRTGAISIKGFYARRILRIFPLYFLVVGLTLVTAIIGHGVMNLWSAPFALTYTYNFVPKALYAAILGHTWSLAVEEHFYLVWPVVVSGLLARGPRTLGLLAAGFFLAAYPVQRAIEVFTSLEEHFFVHRWTFVAGGAIALGSALALTLETHGPGPARRLLSHPLSGWLGALLFLHSLIIDLGDSGPGDQVRAMGICLMVGWLYLNQLSLPAIFLDAAPLRYLGKISYGIYMWQGFFLGTGPERSPGQTWPPSTTWGLALLCLVAPLSFHFFEAPFLRMKARYSQPRASGATAQAMSL